LSRPRRPAAARSYDRVDRLNELLREIVAETLERIDDEDLEFVTITGVSTTRELDRARVFYTCLDGDDLAEPVLEAFEAHRIELKRAIASQARLRRTPELLFEPDDVVRSAERIDHILRSAEADRGDGPAPSQPDDGA
jgi:ribosome-binding factor A